MRRGTVKVELGRKWRVCVSEEGPLGTETSGILDAQGGGLLGDGEMMEFPQGLGRRSLRDQECECFSAQGGTSSVYSGDGDLGALRIWGR